MFSFGTIKYNSAFWGSVSIVREPKSIVSATPGPLFTKMMEIQSKYQLLSAVEYKNKIQKCWLLSFLCQNKTVVRGEKFYFTKLTS